MATRTRKLAIEISSDAKGDGFRETERRVDKLRDKLKRTGDEAGKDAGGGFFSGFRSSVTKQSGGFGSWLSKALRKEFELSATTVATGFSAQLIGSIAAGIASGVGKIAHGLGAVAALLPAAALTGVLAFGTLKVAVLGVGDALSAGLTGDAEQFDEALKSLSPSAQSFAREVVGLKADLDGLRSTVQESLFKPLVGQVRPLADIYLPAVQSAMAGIATQMGATARQAVEFLKLPETASALSTALGDAGLAGQNVVGVAGNLVRAFVPLVTVGTSFLPALTGGLAGASARLADFMANAERTGALRDFIQGGLDKLRELWGTLEQVGRILGNLGAIAGTIFGGISLQSGGLLDSFERLTDRAAAFFETAAGGQVASEVLGLLGSILSNVLGTLQRVAGMLGRAFGPALAPLGRFVEAFFRLKAALLDVALDALEPVLNALGAVLGNVVLPALTGLADLLARNRPVLQGIAIAIGTLLVPAIVAWGVSAGIAAINTLLMLAPLILIGAAIAALAALVIIHFDTIKNVIMGVFHWVQDNWQLLLIILTGPIGAAVVLIVEHWDTIKNAALAAFNWVKDNWQLLLGILTGPITLAVGIITGSLDSVVSFVTGLPERIRTAASGMFGGIVDAFRSAINTVIGWWNGISFKLPTISIPGFDPPGPGPSFGGATIGGQTFSTPDIPMLAHGGIIPARPGGTLVRAAEGGHDEAFIPLDGRHSLGGDTYYQVDVHVQGSVHADRDLAATISRVISGGHPIRDRGRRL